MTSSGLFSNTAFLRRYPFMYYILYWNKGIFLQIKKNLIVTVLESRFFKSLTWSLLLSTQCARSKKNIAIITFQLKDQMIFDEDGKKVYLYVSPLGLLILNFPPQISWFEALIQFAFLKKILTHYNCVHNNTLVSYV